MLSRSETEELYNRHGSRLAVFSEKEFAKMAKALKKFPKAFKALQSFGFYYTPIHITAPRGYKRPQKQFK